MSRSWRSTFFGFRNLYEGAEVRRAVRRAKQYELVSEIDPDANFVVHGRFFVFAPISLGLFDELSYFRQFCVWLVTWHWWDRFILFVIFANAICLGLEDYSPTAVDPVTLQPDASRSAINAFISSVEPLFTALFTFEAVMKIIAMGLVVNRGSYLRDGFNILDAVVVISALLGAIPGVPNISALRAVRVLRPLRTLSRIKSMRIMVGSLLLALPQLGNVALLLFFVFLLWGIMAVQLFPGNLHSRCRITPTPLAIPASHLEPWYPNATAPPWVSAGELQGLLPGAESVIQFVPESRHQPLYFEMMQVYFWGESPTGTVPSDPVMEVYVNASLPLPDGAYDATKDQVPGVARHIPWVAPNFFYLTFAQAAYYVASLTYNRTAFPECGAPGPGQPGLSTNDASWQQDTSPWAEPRQCVWPSDLQNNRVCDDGSGGAGGAYTCNGPAPPWAVDTSTLPGIVTPGTAWAAAVLSIRRKARTCGSPYDAQGNDRFTDARVMRDEVTSDINTIENGDWIVPAMLFMLESVTLESWSTLMYNLQDGYNIYFATIYCVSLTLIGSYIILNLVVATILAKFSVNQAQELEALRARKERIAEIKAAELGEQALAVAKARVVVELKVLHAQQKLRLRRASQDGELLSQGAMEAAAVAAMAARTGDVLEGTDATTPAPRGDDATLDDPIIDPAISAPRGVMRRRVQRLVDNDDHQHSKAARNLMQPVHFSRRNVLDMSGAASVRSGATDDGGSVMGGSVMGGTRVNTEGGRSVHSDDLRSVADDDRGSVARSLEHEDFTEAARTFILPADAPLWVRARLMALGVLSSGTFGLFMMALIVLNTAILALDHYPTDVTLESLSEKLNFGLTIFFALEMTVKLLSLGLTWYIKDRMNVFDAIVVLISLVELAVAPPEFLSGHPGTNNAAVLALRTLRLARIFKLARSWTSLRLLLRMLAESMQDVANFAVLLGLFLFIFGLFGQTLFANRFRLDPKSLAPLAMTDPRFWDPLVYPTQMYNPYARGTFDNIWWSMLSVFQIMTLQNWTDQLMVAYLSQGWLGVAFVAVVVFLGGFVLIDLFLAIMLGHFEGLDDNPKSDAPSSKADAGADHQSAMLQSHNQVESQGLSKSDANTTVRRASIDAALRDRESGSVVKHSEKKRGHRTAIQKSRDQVRLAVTIVRNAMRRQARVLQEVIHAMGDSNVYSCMMRERVRIMAAYAHRRGPSRRGSNRNIHQVGSSRGLGSAGSFGSKVSDMDSVPQHGGIATNPNKPQDESSSIDPSTRASVLAGRSFNKEISTTVANGETAATANQPIFSSGRPVSSISRDASLEDGQLDARTVLSQLSSLRTDELSSAGRGTVGSDAASVSDSDGSESEGHTREIAHDDEDVYRDWQEMLTAAGAGGQRGSGWFKRSARAAGGVLMHTFCCCVLRCVGAKAERGPIDRAFCLLTERQPFRRLCIWLVNHPRFDALVLFVIFASSVCLSIDSPLNDPNSTLAQVLSTLDLVFVIFFTFEMTVRLIALGVFMSPGAYMRSGWNVLDGAIVGVSWLSFFTDGNAQYRSLRALRALRALRPLRVVRRLPGLRLVVHALFRAFRPVLEVVLVCSILFLIFAIILTGLYKGALSTCYGENVFVNPPFLYPVRGGRSDEVRHIGDPDLSDLSSQNVWVMGAPQLDMLLNPVPYNTLTTEQKSWSSIGLCEMSNSSLCGPGYGYGWDTPDDAVPTSKVVCLWFGGTWGPVWPQSFDNVIVSFGTLLEMATTENWANLMYACIDSVGVDMQPQRNRNPIYGLLWLVVMLFGSYFVINLFVAAIVDQFERSREELGENYLLTSAQKEWIKTQESIMTVRPTPRPRPPANLTRRSVYWIVVSNEFEQLILVAIVVNTIALAAPYQGMPPSYSSGLEYLNDGLAVIFTLEMIAKVYAFGARAYFADPWGRFDAVVVIFSDLGILLSVLGGLSVGAIGTLARVLRLGRVVRLAKALKSLRQMVSTLILVMPQLFNVGLLVLLMIFIYAIAGVQLFASVGWDGQYLVAQSNFQNVGRGMLMLYRWVTGENWNMQMYTLAGATYASLNSFPCDNNPPWDEPYPTGCGSFIAYPFGYSFTLLVTFIVVQLLVAVVLEAFSDSAEDEDDTIDGDTLERFASTWVDFDPDCTMFLSTTQLRAFLLALPPPMGLGGLAVVSNDEVNRFILAMRLPTFMGRFVHFSDVSLACARRVLAESMAQRGVAFFDTPNTHAVAKRWEKLRGGAITLQSDFGTQHYLAAESIATAFRVFRFRRALALQS